MRINHENVTIDVAAPALTASQIEMLLKRAAARTSNEEGLTLSAVIEARLRGANYQWADALATRAFAREIKIAREAGEI